ncbi:hypothetical protein FF2_017740 [Malus domestica]
MLNPLLPIPLLFIFLFLVKWIYSTTKTTHKTLPPSPPKFPVLGNLHQLGSRPHRSLQQLAHCYGELLLLHLSIRPVLVVSSSDAAREIMKTNDATFSNAPKLAFVDRLLYKGKDVSVAPYSEYWRRMRSICALQLLRWLSGENIVAGSERGRSFKELLGEFTELLGVFNVGDFIPWLGWINHINGLDAKVEKVAKEFDEFLDVVVEEHGEISKTKEKSSACVDEGEDRRDIVDILLEVQEHSNDMFAGGTDTTYTVLEWAMTRFLRHPRVLKKLQNEIAGIANGKQDIAESDLEKMHYLKAMIKMTLRLHPPIPLLAPQISGRC